MRVPEIIRILDARVLTKCELPTTELKYAFASDMMSDVLALAEDNMLLITSLTNPQAVRTAEMLDLDCILYVRGKIPSAAALSMAEELNITILTTDRCMFTVCGVLFDKGMRGGDNHEFCY